MLTSIYYYNHYKPYILKNENQNRLPKIKLVKNKSNSGNSFQLNKILKYEIVNYARNISKSILNIKQSSIRLYIDIERLEIYLMRKSKETVVSWILEDIEEFTHHFNNSIKILKEQIHSVVLKEFSQKIEKNVILNYESLKKIGIYSNEKNELFVDINKFDSLSMEQISKGLEENRNLINSIYNSSVEMLRVPLSEHMDFKGFNFFYNYTVSETKANTFEMIQEGMIINLTI